MSLVVISDIHVGSGPLDDFDSELEDCLVAFLDELAALRGQTELVINGDFLDFAQAEPWSGKDLEAEALDGTPLCFTEDQSCDKFESILAAHPRLFRALRRFLAAPSEPRLTILPGNHDADFFWANVRQRFLKAVAQDPGPVSRTRFHLEQVYRPPAHPGIWIEHGHQYDPCNWFGEGDAMRWSTGAPPILPDREEVPRLMECVGTRFMIRFMNGLDMRFPFIDNVKPFSKFITMFLASTMIPGFGPLEAAIAYWGFLRFVGRTLRRSPRDLLGASADEDPARTAAGRLLALPFAELATLQERLRERQFSLQGMPLSFFLRDGERAECLLDFVVLQPELVHGLDRSQSGYLPAADVGYLTLARGFLEDETAVLMKAARHIIECRGATGVIMGHTHEAVVPTASLNYVNPGCWTRYYREKADQGRRRSWDLLQGETYRTFPYELAYASLEESGYGRLERRVVAARDR